ncbi:unnamed protein product [Phytophthora lilii]|uniref:Unnamed protein product n=1 Tax=Phytophthora lilii TaxID=2077276 RepID=A0A9W7D8I7_9STRA|nr:unnamed protein product [Phytophthora lilii]
MKCSKPKPPGLVKRVTDYVIAEMLKSLYYLPLMSSFVGKIMRKAYHDYRIVVRTPWLASRASSRKLKQITRHHKLKFWVVLHRLLRISYCNILITMRRSLALLALLALLGTFGPMVLLSHSTVDEHSPSSNGQVVNVIVAGATGDLAAKYLWVALFRLALEAASTSGRTYRFFAGASDSLERGYAWRERFFGEGFAQRVCGAEKGDGQQLSAAQMKCRAFLETEFKPSVTYAPLRMESHYRDLGRRLEHMNEQLPTGISEEGRMVYLAIPPQFFLEVPPPTLRLMLKREHLRLLLFFYVALCIPEL